MGNTSQDHATEEDGTMSIIQKFTTYHARNERNKCNRRSQCNKCPVSETRQVEQEVVSTRTAWIHIIITVSMNVMADDDILPLNEVPRATPSSLAPCVHRGGIRISNRNARTKRRRRNNKTQEETEDRERKIGKREGEEQAEDEEGGSEAAYRSWRVCLPAQPMQTRLASDSQIHTKHVHPQ